jgi:pimeloyl-ACP methyl ester carboxylesterase
MDEAKAREAFFDAYEAVLGRWPVPVERLDLRSRHGTTRVNACGPAGAPPLVLLHGGGATSTIWYANVSGLTRTRRVYALDAIADRGRSVYDGEPMTGLADLMAWLDSCLDGLGVARTDLCGHSYGAWILLRYALHAPGRVDQLALLDPTQCFGGQRLTYLLHAIPLFVRPGVATRRRFFAWETAGALDGQVLSLLSLPFPRPAPRGTKFVWPRRPADEELRGLRMPVLVLFAGRSRQNDVGEQTATVRRLMPHATLDVLPTATHHTLPSEHGEELDRYLGDFFR